MWSGGSGIPAACPGVGMPHVLALLSVIVLSLASGLACYESELSLRAARGNPEPSFRASEPETIQGNSPPVRRDAAIP